MNLEPMSRKARKTWNRRTIGALALGVMLSAMPALAQQGQPNQSDQSGAPGAEPQNQQGQQAQQDQSVPPQQDQQTQQDQQAPPPDQGAPPPQQYPRSRPANLPETLTIPAGTVIQIRTSDWLSSDHNKKGDPFTASLVQPIVVDGWVVTRRNQNVTGEVTDAVRAGRVKGVSRLQLELSHLTLVDGQLLPVQTTLLNASAGTSKGRDASAIAATTATGAAIGAAATGGPGAAIGAGAGFVASVAGVLLTRGKPTIIPPEDVLTFRLENPVTISTVRSNVAFRPVTAQDYAQAPKAPARPRLVRPYPGPYGYYPYAYGPYPYYPPVAYYGYRWGW
jgi:hypothetical protein